jgi:ATP-dependent Clp protease protease subunit
MNKPLRLELKDKIIISNVELTYAFNVENRQIYLEPLVESVMPVNLLQQLNQIVSLSTPAKKQKPINIIINNYGGDGYAMLGIYDIIRSYPVKINTYIIGAAMSAGALIAACATGKRYISKNSSIMIHQTSAWLQGSGTQIMMEADQVKKQQDSYFQLLEKHSKKDHKFWSKKTLSSNLYMEPNTALEYGLVDEIV